MEIHLLFLKNSSIFLTFNLKKDEGRAIVIIATPRLQ